MRSAPRAARAAGAADFGRPRCCERERRSPRKLANAYRALGAADVTLKLYPVARHELFNETNRDEVVRDLIAWLDAKARRSLPGG